MTEAGLSRLLNDGIFNDAPDVITDLNHDGVVNADDLKLLGVASNVETVNFHINADPA